MDPNMVDIETELSQARYALNFARAYEPSREAECRRRVRRALAAKRKAEPPLKLPRLRDLRQLFVALKPDIGDEYRASEDSDDKPGMQVTIGWSEDGAWSYQTGNNEYHGNAYGYPHWAVVSLYRRSDSRELARDVLRQLADLANGY